MTKIICISTLKGGVAKTLSTFSIAGILAEKGKKVLCIDVDPQANLTSNFGIDISNLNLKGSKEIFDYKNNRNYPLNSLIIKNPIKELKNLDLIPATMMLHEAEFELPFATARESILNYYLLDNKKTFAKYDYVFIDTNPSMGYLNQNAFYSADSIILLMNSDMSSINGVRLFRAIWNSMRNNLRIKDNVDSIFITMFDKRTNISKDFIDYVKNNSNTKDIADLLCNTVIPINIKLKESTMNHKTINVYDNKCIGYEAYNKLVNELIEGGVL